MKTLVIAALLCAAGCAAPADSLEYQAATMHTDSMEAAIRAAKPGEPCGEACRGAAKPAPEHPG
jgi:hypothetical protein